MPFLGAENGKESIMKNNYSIAERNRIVEAHLHCIDTVICCNRSLIQAAHLEYDDVYQDLAICLILCVEQFDPEKGSLRRYIHTRLCNELRNRKEIRRLTDFGLRIPANLSLCEPVRCACALI